MRIIICVTSREASPLLPLSYPLPTKVTALLHQIPFLGAYLLVLIASVCKNFSDAKGTISSPFTLLVFGLTLCCFLCTFHIIYSFSQMEYPTETYAFDSTRRPRHCSSSCLWQTSACACTHIHTNTYTNRHSSAEGSRWSLSNRTPFSQTSRTMIEIFLVHLVGRSRRTTMSIAKIEILSKSYISFERTINAMVTWQSELKWISR